MAVSVDDSPVAAGPVPAVVAAVAVAPLVPAVRHAQLLLQPLPLAAVVVAAADATGPGRQRVQRQPVPEPGRASDDVAAARRPDDPPGFAGSCDARYHRQVPV